MNVSAFSSIYLFTFSAIPFWTERWGNVVRDGMSPLFFEKRPQQRRLRPFLDLADCRQILCSRILVAASRSR